MKCGLPLKEPPQIHVNCWRNCESILHFDLFSSLINNEIQMYKEVHKYANILALLSIAPPVKIFIIILYTHSPLNPLIHILILTHEFRPAKHLTIISCSTNSYLFHKVYKVEPRLFSPYWFILPDFPMAVLDATKVCSGINGRAVDISVCITSLTDTLTWYCVSFLIGTANKEIMILLTSYIWDCLFLNKDLV